MDWKTPALVVLSGQVDIHAKTYLTFTEGAGYSPVVGDLSYGPS